MKDDKNYVYLKVSLQKPYPEVEVVRRLETDGSKYFGPYLKAHELKRLLDLLQDVLNYREHPAALAKLNRQAEAGSDSAPVAQVASLDEQIGQSCGVARGVITQAEYYERIEHLVAFFKGDHKPITEAAKAQMMAAASQKKFERAAKLRDALSYIENLTEKQIASDTSGENIDVFGVSLSRNKALIVVLQARNGKLIGESSHSLQGQPDTTAEALAQFLPQYYSGVPDLPDLVILSEEVADQTVLQDWLSQQASKPVVIRVPERGKKSHLLELAQKNAAEKVKQLEAKWEAAARNLEEALTGLKDALNLTALPKRIEGYDISHLGGTETVGSLVVAKNGKPAPADYRNFTIQTLKATEVDDYKALKEVLRRRLLHLSASLKELEQQWLAQDLTFGKGKKSDLDALAEIIKDNPHHLHPDPIDPKEFIVARQAEEIVGCARLHTHTDKTLEIKTLWVKKEFRGGKLGQFLCRKLMKPVTKAKIYTAIHPDQEAYFTEIGFQYVRQAPAVITKANQAAKKHSPKFKEGMVLVSLPASRKPDKSLQSKPDLMVIDGGKGQLSAVKEVMTELQIDIPVIGLAKREEEVFIPGQAHPVNLKANSQASFLLQRLRNEAHRVANLHREKRLAKSTFGSALDEITGIGPKSKKELLKAFGSVSGIKAAPDNELLKHLSGAQLKALRKGL